MGPVIIFDKSTLESLNPDEAVWLDNFYLSNITPLFFVETLADLEKEVRAGRTPEQIVGSLAYKTPDYGSKPNAHHTLLLQGELLGHGKLDLEYGRPHITGGKTVELEGKTGVIFEPSPEEEALSRWQDYKFMELERLRAKKWRQGLSNIDFEYHYKGFQAFFPLGKPKNLADVKKFVDFYINSSDQESVLGFGLSLLGIVEEGQERVIKRWKEEGSQNINQFAPYFTHVFSVDFFFYLAIAADIIGRGRSSHKIDIAYLYYLPFCMVFTSNDKLHADIAPFFLRENQSFIPGNELKADLGKLDKHYDSLPQEEKERGIISFAFYPPKDDGFLITRLWDKHMSPDWRKNDIKLKPQPDTPIAEMIRKEMKQMEDAPESAEAVGLDGADHMVIRRMVRGTKGKWKRFPPEVMNRRKNADGEWEDIPKTER